MPRWLNQQRFEDAMSLYAILRRGGMDHEQALARVEVSYGPNVQTGRRRNRLFRRSR